MKQTLIKHSRLLIGIALCIFAIAGTVGVIAISKESSIVLVAAKDIKPGEQISVADLTEVNANLGDLGDQFLRESDFGGGVVYANDFIRAGEILPKTKTTANFNDALVAVSVKPSVQPSVGIRIGAVVDVWVIPKANSLNLTFDDLPRVIAHKAKVIDIQRIEGFGITTTYQYEIAIQRTELVEILAVVGAGEEIAVVEGVLQDVSD